MKLLIISHTRHYKNENGTIVGWGPTINELNNIIDEFDEIIHVAMLHSEVPPKSSLPYVSSKIKFVALPALGGKTIFSKLKMIFLAPKIIHIVSREIKSSDIFQLRTPTGIGVFLIPYLTWFVNTKGWYKYAGNWNQENPPLGYRFQRWMLKNQKRKVTINGTWKNQPEHCITFENPCLTLQDFENGKQIITKKNYKAPWSFCFVGRLEKAKGVERIIKAFSALTEDEKDKISQVDLVGDGAEIDYFKEIALKSGVKINFHGFLPRNDVFDLYKKTPFFLLPSDSEGFPKVIAEAMNFGCIPIVSDVSSIGQYINKTNGYLLSPITSEKLIESLTIIINERESNLQEKAKLGTKVSIKFTFDNYKKRIKEKIIKLIEK
jgi:glycosyltransferase involved in cell wall biosynthesis